MSVTIYHNSRCSKSNKSCALLTAQGVEYKIIEYLKTPLTQEEIQKLLSKLNMRAEDLIRKGESVFKENFKDKTLTDTECINIMVEHPILMQRPIVVKGNKAIIGRPVEKVVVFLAGEK